MNINEIIANAALLKTGNKCGNYTYIDPTSHSNIYQSTNDVIPTALTVASIKLLQELEEKINLLRQKVETYEKQNRRSSVPAIRSSRKLSLPLSDCFSARTMKLFRVTGAGFEVFREDQAGQPGGWCYRNRNSHSALFHHGSGPELRALTGMKFPQ